MGIFVGILAFSFEGVVDAISVQGGPNFDGNAFPKRDQRIAKLNKIEKKSIQKGAKREPETAQNVQRETPESFEEIGREQILQGGKGASNFLTIWRHLVDLGGHLGASWILKRSQNRSFSHKINIKSKKGRPGRLFEKP